MQVSHHGNISDPPPDSSWSYRATDSALMADGLSVWPVRRSGIPYRIACGIRLLAGTVSDNLWRRFCLQRTDAFSALEVSRRCAINRLFTYLLTYLLTSVQTSSQDASVHCLLNLTFRLCSVCAVTFLILDTEIIIVTYLFTCLAESLR